MVIKYKTSSHKKQQNLEQHIERREVRCGFCKRKIMLGEEVCEWCGQSAKQ